MTITIPPEALAAAKETFVSARTTHADPIEAACLAMLAAWPGIELDETMWSGGTNFLILPLPQEKPNERI